jgi:ADP-ribosylglycohydrolase
MYRKLQGMLWGSFIGDSHALGAHWIYDQERIRRQYGLIEALLPPGTNYHKGKTAGDFTHYGDQALWLLESLEKNRGWKKDRFVQEWRTKMEAYQGYHDHATHETCDHMDAGDQPAGSLSTELAGAVRIAPLIYFYYNDPKLMTYVVEETAMTHRTGKVTEAAVFLAKVVLLVISGVAPVEAIEKVLSDLAEDSMIAGWIAKGLKEDSLRANDVIKNFGQTCDISHALPSSIYLIRNFEESLALALEANAMAGGDSAARGMFVGMVLGAHHGISGIPQDWLNALGAKETIESYIGAKK